MVPASAILSSMMREVRFQIVYVVQMRIMNMNTAGVCAKELMEDYYPQAVCCGEGTFTSGGF